MRRSYMLTRFALLLIPIFMIGCVVNPMPHEISRGFIKNDDVIIEAEDGSFKLESGKEFAPPFQNETYTYFNYIHAGDANVVGSYQKMLDNGLAKKVIINFKGSDNKLYGVILFSKVYMGAYGPSSKSYLINIPNSYIDQAKNGKISCCYEYYQSDAWNFPQDAKPKTWILWLSDMPF